MEQTRDIPTEPQIDLSVVNDRYTLGTMTALKIDTDRFSAKNSEEFRQEMAMERT
jgi:hypothetical protein